MGVVRVDVVVSCVLLLVDVRCMLFAAGWCVLFLLQLLLLLRVDAIGFDCCCGSLLLCVVVSCCCCLLSQLLFAYCCELVIAVRCW